jgi:hypothetical protein
MNNIQRNFGMWINVIEISSGDVGVVWRAPREAFLSTPYDLLYNFTSLCGVVK